MFHDLQHLTDSEKDFLMKSPILVCILIAGADGTIDRKEINEAIVQAKKKTSTARTGGILHGGRTGF